MRENKYIDVVFRQKLNGFEKNPPEEVWSNISSHLRQDKKIIPFQLLWKVAAGFAILLTTGLGFYILSNKNNSDKEIAVEQAEVKASPEEIKTAPEIKSVKEEKIIISEYPIASVPKPQKTNSMPQEEKRSNDMSEAYLDETRIEKEKSTDRNIELHRSRLLSYSTSLNLPYHFKPTSAKEEKIPERDYSPHYNIPEKSFFEPGEEGLQKSTEFRQWMVTAMAAPEYSYRSIKDGAMAASDYFNNSEKPRMTFSGGLQIGYQLTKRLNLQSGLFFSRSGIEISRLSAYDAFELSNLYNSQNINRSTYLNVANSIGDIVTDNPNLRYLSYNKKDNIPISKNNFEMITVTLNGTTDLPNPVDGGLIQYFDFIEFPFNLKYRVVSGLINLNFLGGVSSNFLIGNKIIFQTNGNKMEDGRTENIKIINYSGNFGLSLDYLINEHFLFMVEPRFKYYLQSINKDNLIYARPYMIGIFSGVSYKF